jgi:hypothetical protein
MQEYSLWNAAFVYLNFPAVAAHQIAVLASAWAVGLIDPRRWLQARTYTLATSLLLLATFPRTLIPLTDSTHWATPQREEFVAWGCLVIVAGHCTILLVRRATSARLSVS